MTTSNPAGRPPSTEPTLPELTSYTEEEWAQASAWPAISRYRSLLERAREATLPAHELRLRRHEKWLKASLATFFGRTSTQEICEYWSAQADQLILEAWKTSGCDETGMALLALGKLGARELNLSSDVDLIAVRADGTDPELKRLREFQSLLQDFNEFAFGLRVDFTLRPGGKSSPAIPSISEFEYHYGYQGEMWERLAFVRMRILAGSETLREDIQQFSRKFSFRKHLDYTLLDELCSLRSKIRREKFESRPGTFHLKLGEGGIRELELFVHALQVIHGGRNPRLQTSSTHEAIERIEELGLLPAAECEKLKKAYWFLRDLENHLQGFDDQQVYLVDLQNPPEALPQGFAPPLERIRSDVVTIATSLFKIDESPTDFPQDLELQKAWLAGKGFSRASIDETWPEILQATALSRKTERDEFARLEFLKGFVSTLAEIQLDRDLALSLLLDFVKGIRAKASFFTLLNRETRIRDEIAQLFSVSPYLGSILALRPELIDEFIFRKLAPPSGDMNTLLENLAERRLLAELISATHFLRDHDLRNLCANITDNADAIALTLLERLREDYGPSHVHILALGKWGGRELGLRSDLDFIFVTSGAPTENDQKVAKRFMSRMTEPHRGGSIYSIDMRLRPSGSAGPIMVQESELERYLQGNAAAWERQAYTRARWLENPERFFRPAQTGSMKGLNTEDVRELDRIRIQLFSQSKPDEIDLKLSPGGLADVEFTAQIALLARGEFSLDPSTSGMIQYLESRDERWKRRGPLIRERYDFLRRIEQLYQLTTRLSGSKVRPKSDEFRRLAQIESQSPEDLEIQIRETRKSLQNDLQELRISTE